MTETTKALLDLKKIVHDKAVYPNSQDVPAYISIKVFDAILQDYVSKLEGKK
jgi:hypothetical protein